MGKMPMPPIFRGWLNFGISVALPACYRRRFGWLLEIAKVIVDAGVVAMLRNVFRIVQLQFLLLCVLIFCTWVAGPKNAVPWFAFVSLGLLSLTVGGMIIRNRQR